MNNCLRTRIACVFGVLVALALAIVFVPSRLKRHAFSVETSHKIDVESFSDVLTQYVASITGSADATTSVRTAALSRAMSRPRARFADLPRTDSEIFVSSGDVLAEARVNRDADAARRASDLNQVMDALLDQPEIPADYGRTMVSIFRDRSRGVLERGFAVQHIGLYAAALNRRGVYDPAESSSLRAALWDASLERDSGVGAAALRALADMAAFDPGVGTARLDVVIASYAADASCATPVRVMAIQLSGERHIASARQAIAAIAADPASPEMLRRPARYALAVLDGKEVAQ